MKFDLRQPGRTALLRWVFLRVKALRAFALPVSVLPVLAATAVLRPLTQWRWDVLAASILGVTCLHCAGNLLNDYFDFRSGVDRKANDDEGRPGRLLLRGELEPRDILTEATVCLLITVPVGIYLFRTCGAALLWFAGAALFALYAYTGPPLKLKYRACGELLVFVVFGPVLMVGAAYAQTGRIEWLVLPLSIPVGLATTAVLLGNNIRDRQEDGKAHILTLAQLMAPGAVRLLYTVLIVLSTLGLALLAVLRLLPAPLLLAPALLVLILRPARALWRGERLSDIDVQTARFVSALLLFLITVLVLPGGDWSTYAS